MLSNKGTSQRDDQRSAQRGQPWASFWSVLLVIPRLKKRKLTSESGRTLYNRIRWNRNDFNKPNLEAVVPRGQKKWLLCEW